MVKIIDSIAYWLKSIIKKPLKIGLVSYYYPKDSDSIDNGVAIHVYYLSRKLAEFGCEVHVFAKGERNSMKKSYPGKGKLVVHMINTYFDSPFKDIVAKKRMSYFIFDNKIINEITKENSNRKFDIIHTHGWLTAGAFISKYLNDMTWIHTFHAVEKNRLKFMSKDEKKYFKIARWVESTARYADALIAVSENLKKEILENYLLKKEKVYYIPNGVDLNVFKPENIASKEKQILYIGRFSLEKGIDLLPDIAKNVLENDKNTKFLVIATGGISPSLRYVKEEFDYLLEKYPERFFLERESKTREQIARVYNESLICIQPSRYESFGLVMLEAMACGKAVVCSNLGGLPEVVDNAGIISILNTKRFVYNISKLLKDFRLRERYARRGIERAKMFDWDKIAGKTLALYKKIAQKK